MKNKKIVSLIVSILMLIISGFMIYLCYSINSSLAANTGLQRLGLVILIPVVIIVYIIMTSSSVTALISSIKTMHSEIKGIKITGIILFILSLCAIGLVIWVIVKLFIII